MCRPLSHIHLYSYIYYSYILKRRKNFPKEKLLKTPSGSGRLLYPHPQKFSYKIFQCDLQETLPSCPPSPALLCVPTTLDCPCSSPVPSSLISGRPWLPWLSAGWAPVMLQGATWAVGSADDGRSWGKRVGSRASGGWVGMRPRRG